MSKIDARLMEPGVSGSALIVLWVSSAEGPRVWIVAVFPLMPVEAIRESGAPNACDRGPANSPVGRANQRPSRREVAEGSRRKVLICS